MAEILSQSNTENFRIYKHKKFNKPAPSGYQEVGGTGGGNSGPGVRYTAPVTRNGSGNSAPLAVTQEKRLQPTLQPGSRSSPQPSRSPQQSRRGTNLKRPQTSGTLLQTQSELTQNIVVKSECTKLKQPVHVQGNTIGVSDLDVSKGHNTRSSRVVTPDERGPAEKRRRVQQPPDVKVFSPHILGSREVARVPGVHLGLSGPLNFNQQPSLTAEVNLGARASIVPLHPLAIKLPNEYTPITPVRPVAIKEEPRSGAHLEPRAGAHLEPRAGSHLDLVRPQLLFNTAPPHSQHNDIPPPLLPIRTIQQTTHFSNQAGHTLGTSSRQSAVPYPSSFPRPSGSRPEASTCAEPDDVPLNLSAPKTSRIQQPQPSTSKEEKPLDLSTKNLKRKSAKKAESSEHRKGQHKDIEKIVPPSLLEKINIRSTEELKHIETRDLNAIVKKANLTDEEKEAVKVARRLLKNRGYSFQKSKKTEDFNYQEDETYQEARRQQDRVHSQRDLDRWRQGSIRDREMVGEGEARLEGAMGRLGIREGVSRAHLAQEWDPVRPRDLNQFHWGVAGWTVQPGVQVESVQHFVVHLE